MDLKGPDFSYSGDPIFFDSRGQMIIFSDSWDPIFNSRQWSSVFNRPNNYGAGSKRFWMLDPDLEPKT